MLRLFFNTINIILRIKGSRVTMLPLCACLLAHQMKPSSSIEQGGVTEPLKEEASWCHFSTWPADQTTELGKLVYIRFFHGLTKQTKRYALFLSSGKELLYLALSVGLSQKFKCPIFQHIIAIK